MAMKKKDTVKKKRSRRSKAVMAWPLGKQNYYLFGLGILVLIIGYVFLAQGPWDSFSSRTLAPIILVIGYCIVIPLSIMYRKKGGSDKK